MGREMSGILKERRSRDLPPKYVPVTMLDYLAEFEKVE
jgi:hypothetical protein